jgi:hypothetical protein
VLVAIFVPSYMKAFDGSRLARDARAVSHKGLSKPATGLRCPARLHATRHIRASRNEPLFRVVLLRGIGLGDSE